MAGDRFSLGSQFRTTVTIRDNDARPDVFTLKVSPDSIAESAGETPVTVTVTLTGTSLPVATDFNLAVSGMESTDYTLTGSRTVTVLAESLTGSTRLALSPIQDTTVEPTGFIDFTATAVGFAAQSPISLQLTDDDINLELDRTMLRESAGETEITVTARLGSPASTDIGLALVLGGTAHQVGPGADYSVAALPTLRITGGSTTGTAVISLTPIDDSIAEGAETITVTGTANNGFTVVDVPELALEDNDTAPTRITLRVSPDRLTEGSGATLVTVTATLGDGSVSLPETLLIPLSLAGTAISPEDYGLTGDDTITIAGGATTATITLQITPLRDNLQEDETIEVGGVLDGYTVIPASITLQDPGFTVTAALAAISVAEGIEARVGVTVASADSVDPQGDVRVSYVLVDATTRTGADYEAPSGSLLFTVGDFSGGTATKFINILIHDDVVDEANEQFTVILQNPTGAAGDRFSLGGQFLTTVTIQDNDAPPDAFTLTISPDSIAESAGETPVTVTVTLTGTSLPVDTAFTLTLGGMATEGMDYTLMGARTVTVSAESLTGSTQLDLSPMQDVTVEPAETIRFTATADRFADQTEALELTDDDIGLALSSDTLAEPAGQTEITVTATLGGPASTDIALTLVLGGTANPGADYSTATLPTLSITDGATTGTAVLSLTPVDDSIVEGTKSITVTATADNGFTVVNMPELALEDDETAPSAITLRVSPDRLTEGSGAIPVTVTATLGRGSVSLSETLNIPLSLGGTAGSPGDYTFSGTPSITIVAGATMATTTLQITPLRDNLLEEEMITVGGVLPGYDVTPATIILRDPGFLATVAATAISVAEGGIDARVEVTVASADSVDPQGDVRVSYVLVDATTRTGADYEAPSGSLLFTVGDFSGGTATKFINILIHDDIVDEGDEQFTVILGLPTGAAGERFGLGGQSRTTVTIQDNDAPPDAFTLTVSPHRIAESAGETTVTMTVTLTDTSLATDTEFALTLGGVATEGTDYTLAGARTVTVLAESLTGSTQLDLSPMQDVTVEPSETVQFTATATGFSDQTGSLELTDDDISLSLSPNTLAESAGTTAVTVAATLGGPASTDIDLTLALGGTANREGPAADYSAVALPTLSITGGQTTGTAVINLNPTDDSIAEGAESITVTGTADNGFTVVNVPELALEDDNTAPTMITLEVTPTRLTEGSGEIPVTVTATLGDGSVSLPEALSIPLSLGGTARFSTDYTFSGTPSIGIVEGTTTATTILRITPLRDNLLEDEMIELGGTLSGYTVTPASIILQDPGFAVTTALAAIPVAEGMEARVGVTVASTDSVDPQGDVRVPYTLEDGTTRMAADYVAPSGSLLFAVADFSGGTATRFISIPTSDDVVDEEDEQFTVILQNPMGATGDRFSLGSQFRTAVTIQDNDAPPNAFTLVVSPDSIAESAGETPVTVTVVLTDTSLTADTEFALTLGGMATEGMDYTLMGARTVTVSAESLTGSTQLALSPMQDVTVEPAEAIQFTATAARFTTSSAILLQLTDDDIGLELDRTTLEESASQTEITVMATLGSPASTDIDLTLALGGTANPGGVDYSAAVLPALSITGGSTTGTAVISLTPVDDDIVEGTETITVRATASRGFMVVDVPELALEDNETAPSVVTLRVTPEQLTEGSGEIAVTVTATLGNDSVSLPEPLIIPLGLGGTADSSVDYILTGTRSLTVIAGATMATTTLRITPLADDQLEVETIEVGGVLNGYTVIPASITLRDPGFTATATAATVLVAEGEAALVEITVASSGSVPPRGNVRVPYTLIDDTTRMDADYGAPSGSLIFTVGDFSGGTATESINILTHDDVVDEGDEQFTVILGLPTGAAGERFGLGGQSRTTVTIQDNDARPDAFTLTVSPDSIAESAGETPVTVTVTLTGTSLATDTEFALTLGGVATGGTDYTLAGARTVTVLAESLTGSTQLDLSPMQDVTVEPSETVQFTATATGFSDQTGSLELTDDDISLSLSPNTLAESAGTTAVTVTATLGGPASTDIDLILALGGTANREGPAADYSAIALPTLSITGGQTTGTAVINLNPTDDSIAEGAESITVTGTADNGFTVVNVPELALEDDNTAPTMITLEVTPTRLTEGSGEIPVTVTATLGDGSVSLPKALSIPLSLGGTASFSVDYTFSGTPSIGIVEGTTTATTTLRITPLRDNLLEDEMIELGGALSGYTVTPASITLQDPDFAVTTALAAISVAEGSAARVGVTVASTDSVDPQGDVRVPYTLADGTTRMAADYVAPSGSLLFAVADFSGGTATRFISIPTRDDVVDEEDEQFTVILQNPMGATGDRFSLGSQFRTAVTIQDNDAPPNAFTLMVSPDSIAESAGETPVTVTVTLTDTSLTADTEFALMLGGMATEGMDYTLMGARTVTVSAESLTGSTQLALSPMQDVTVEPTEAIQFTATAARFTAPPAILLQLTDDDIGLSLSPAMLAEPAGTTEITVMATLGSPASTDIDLTLALGGTASPGGVDYSAAVLPALNITGGSTTGTAVISLTPVDDDIVEGTETITVTATANRGFTVVEVPELALEDNETAPSVVTLRVSPEQLTEGSGEIAVTVTATLGDGSVSLPEPLIIPLGLGGTADSSVDYVLTGTRSLTVIAGATMATTTLRITPLADEQLEVETIEVGGVLNGYTVIPASITLRDPGFTATATAATVSVAEGEAALVEITVASSSSVSPRGDVTVPYTLADGTTRMDADYEPPSGSLIFTVGDFSGGTATRFISIPTRDDVVDEVNEQFAVILEPPTGAAGDRFSLGGQSRTTVTIRDNDARPDVFTLMVSPGRIAESAGETPVTVTVTLTGTSLPAATEFILDVSGMESTDYTLTGARTVTVLTESLTGSTQLVLSPIQDVTVEPSETVQFTATATGFSDQTGSLELTDDDINLELDRTMLRESAGETDITVTARLGSPASMNIGLILALGGSATRESLTADYSAAALPVLRIDRGQTMGTAVITLTPMDDSITEGAETITVTGTADNGFTVVDVPGLVLEDNDTAPTEIILKVTPNQLTEGSREIPVTVTATLGDGSVGLPEPLRIPLSLAGTANSPEDYLLAGTLSLTLVEGTTTATTTLRITPLRDNLLEDETIEVGGVLDGYTVTPASITLQDPGFAVTTALAAISVAEGTEARVGVTVASTDSVDPQGDVRVPYTLVDGTTRRAADYAAPSGSLLFAVGDFSGGTATRFISIPTSDDVVDEEDEQFTVILQNPTGTAGERFSLGDRSRTAVTIQDNDARPSAFTLTVSPDRVAESAGETPVTVTVTLTDTSLTADTEFALTLGGVATEDTDYTLMGARTVTVSAESLTGSTQLALRPVQDVTVEPIETIQFTATAARFTAPPAILLQLTDDDIGLSLSPAMLAEFAGTTAITVTATLGSPVSTDIDLTLALGGTASPGGVDYSAAALPTLSITRGVTMGTAVISLTPVDDNIVEGTETITVTATANRGFTVVEVPELALGDDETIPSGVTLRVSPDRLTEGSGEIAVTVTATLGDGSVGLPEALIIPLHLAGTASATEDYTFVGMPSLTIVADAATATTTLRITPLADEQLEVETIEVGGVLDGYTVIPASITLQDPSFTATAAAATVSVAEGEAALVEIAVASSGSVPPRGDVRVSYTLADGTTRMAADYVAPSGSLIFAVADFSGGTATAFISIPTRDDVVNEEDEQFTVILEPPTGVAGDRFSLGSQFRTTVTIRDNDARPDVFTLKVSPDSIAESAGETPVTVTVTLTGTSLPAATDFNLAVSGMESTDYTLTGSRTVTVPAESLTGSTQLALSPIQDATVEPTGFIDFTATAVGFAAQSPISLQLTDDDINLGLDRTMLGESAGETEITVTARLGSPASMNIDLTLALGGTANPEGLTADYSAAALPVLRIDRGQTMGTAVVTLTPIDDSIAEVAETITVTGTAGNGFTVVDVPGLVLEDNDTAPTEIILKVTPDQLTEGSGEIPVTVTATLGDGSASLPEPLLIPLSLAGTANSPEDYLLAGTPSLTLVEGTTTATTTLRITPLRDNLLEDETIEVGGVLDGYTVIPASITLQDPGFAVTTALAAISVAEGTETRVGVTVASTDSVDPQGDVRVPYTLEDGTTRRAADYAAPSGSLLFAVGDFSGGTATRFISIPTSDDVVDEEDEQFTVILQNPTGATGDRFSLGSQFRTAVTIQDNDARPSAFTLTVSPDRVAESAGETPVTVTVTLTDTSLTADTEFALTLGGMATESMDYTLMGARTVTVSAESLTGSTQLALRPVQDVTVEPTETIQFTATAARFTAPPAILLQLTDDDIGLSLNPDTLAEFAGTTAITVTATLGSPVSTDIDLTLALGGTASPGGVDYSAAALPTLSITRGVTMGTAVISLTPVDDIIVEGTETITVTATANRGFTVVEVPELALEDDETIPSGVTLRVTPDRLTEGSGEIAVTVTATLGDGSVGLPEALIIPLHLAGTASAPEDYTFVWTPSLTIVADAATATTTLRITPLADEQLEVETIEVGGVLDDYTVTPASITLQDPSFTATATAATVSVAEGEAALVEIAVASSSSVPPRGDVRVPYTLADGTTRTGADYVAPSGSLIFAVGDFSGGTATKFISIPTRDDVVNEEDEQFTVILEPPTGVAGDRFSLGSQFRTTVTIRDNDTRPDAFTLMVSPDSIAESAGETPVTVTVTLTGTSLPAATDFNLAVSGMESTDYTLTGSRTVTVLAESVTGSTRLALSPTQDMMVEPTGTIRFTATAAGAGFAASSAALLQLTDDDISLELNPTMLGESAGQTAITVTATLGSSASMDIDLTLALGGTANPRGPAADYSTAALPTLRIADGAMTGTAIINLSPVDDDVAEGTETITVTGTADNSFTVVEVPELALEDNDTAPTEITLVVVPDQLTEGSGEIPVTVTATLGDGSVSLPEALVIPLSLGGTADFPEDYTLTGTTPLAIALVIAEGTTTGTTTLQITPLRDSRLENEMIVVDSTSPGYTVTPASIALQDAGATFTVAVPATVQTVENAGAASVTITISGSTAPQGRITVPWTLVAGTATEHKDYRTASGGVRFDVQDFSAGMATRSISIPVINDTVHEDDESFTVMLGTPVGETVDQFNPGQSSSVVTIQDDDPKPALFALEVSPGRVEESASVAELTITVSWLNRHKPACCYDLQFGLGGSGNGRYGLYTGWDTHVDDSCRVVKRECNIATASNTGYRGRGCGDH